MLNLIAEKSLARLLMVGSVFISVFVLWGTVTDPVNVTKLLALGGIAAAGFATTMSFGAKNIWAHHKRMIFVLFLFFLAVINSAIQSSAPTSQLIYGSFGRNTGLITYVLLILLFVAALGLSQKSSFLKISNGLLVAGAINVIYCIWVIAFGDFIGWSNPYGNILGTFGNPNFIGAFLGIFASVLFAFLVQPNLGIAYRLSGSMFLLLTFFEIKSSHAIQGIVVAAGGMSLVGFYFLRSKSKSIFVPIFYSVIVLIFGMVATLGALQIGPLKKLIYKTSVSLRGVYWHAAWNMGSEFPLSGVGMDTYGDWFRRLRDDHALIFPGPSVISNAAHNVVVDQFAYGGWPMLLTYLTITVFVLLAIIKVSIRKKEFDFTFIGLAVAWICYQVQSFISINQIGLAIWGWLLGGSIIGFERATRFSSTDNDKSSLDKPKRKLNASKESFGLSPSMVAFLGAVVGLLIASPPISSDVKWKTALGAGSLERVEQALTPGFLNPLSSYRYNEAVQLFEQNNLYEQSYKYAKIAVAFNRDSFDSWNLLYHIKNATPEDREIAKKNLVRLDPKNQHIFEVPKQ
jgi:hypothetical protein